MHLNNYVHVPLDADWKRLVTAKGVRAVVVQRDALKTFCSIDHARSTQDWGHTPAAHKNKSHACPATSKAARDFVTKVPERFDAASKKAGISGPFRLLGRRTGTISDPLLSKSGGRVRERDGLDILDQGSPRRGSRCAPRAARSSSSRSRATSRRRSASRRASSPSPGSACPRRRGSWAAWTLFRSFSPSYLRSWTSRIEERRRRARAQSRGAA